MNTITMQPVPDTLPARVRLRCLNCGTQWVHGAWEQLDAGVPLELPGTCPMCNMLLRYITSINGCSCGFYELSDQEVHYDY